MTHLNYQNVEQRERCIQFIMFCVLNGELDINSPGIKEFLKGKDCPVSYMRELSPESLNQLHMNVFSKLKKFKQSSDGKMLIRSDLLSCASFDLDLEEASTGKVAYQLINRVEALIDGVYHKKIKWIDINSFASNPNNVIIPTLCLIFALIRPYKGGWRLHFLLKADPTDEIWK